VTRDGPEGPAGVDPEATAGGGVSVDFSDVIAVPLFYGLQEVG